MRKSSELQVFGGESCQCGLLDLCESDLSVFGEWDDELLEGAAHVLVGECED